MPTVCPRREHAVKVCRRRLISPPSGTTPVASLVHPWWPRRVVDRILIKLYFQAQIALDVPSDPALTCLAFPPNIARFHDRPDHFALSHRRKTGRRRHGSGL